jgi:hypothetical protein
MSSNNIIVTLDNTKRNTETTSVVINSSRISVVDELYHCNDVTTLDNVTNCVLKLGGSSFRLNTENTSRDILEQYVSQIAKFHSSRLNLSTEKSLCIEFSLITNNINHCNIVYDKPNYDKTNKKNSPVFSVITNLGNGTCPLLLTDINHQQYKYKNFNEQEQNKLLFLNKYTHLVFDSSKYHGFANIFNELDDGASEPYLLINVWSYPLDNIPYYSSSGTTTQILPISFTNINEAKHTQSVDASCLNYDFFERVLYGNIFVFNDQFVTNIQNARTPSVYRINLQIKKSSVCDTICASDPTCVYDYKNDKRFIQRFVCPNVFPDWICEWFTREVTTLYNKTDISGNILDISVIPNISHFIFANISYIMDKIIGFYCLGKGSVDIQYIKFIKYKVFRDEKLNDNFDEKSLLRICICISNNKTDGHIVFDDNISVNMSLGSMLVHLNNINYRRTPVIQGEEICIIMGVNLN